MIAIDANDVFFFLSFTGLNALSKSTKTQAR
jgi:hypothetical protein